MEEEVAIQMNDVTKRFGKKVILNALQYELQKGHIYGFIGPSGSGKTTLIKLIVGMDVPNEGTITLLGKKMPNLAVLQQIGYMAQSDALYTALTGRENLQFFASVFKLSKAQTKERIAYTAKLVHLNEDLDKKVSAYSGGMKRRLSLAIAIIQNPQVIILDEPTVGIDPALRVTIWNELLRLKNEEGKTIIVTTHVMDEAEHCDEIAMLRDGQFIATGSPAQLKAAYRVNSLNDVFLQAGGAAT
ncbi:MAG: ABC transporter ATP-binding protein [Caryophanon sp.]|nr:ABC transporter ATP-binding protein [Caryophanon sp.]